MSQDHDLQEAVLAELTWEPSVIAAHIGVAAKAGIVTLTGHVETYSEKLAAEEATLRVRGVRAVAEEIEVRVPFDRQRGDDDIAAAAIGRMAWSASIPADRFSVKVEKDWVTLTGAADWYYQKEEAGLEVRRLMGVTGLSNQIPVKPRVNTSMLSDNINHALHRSWFFDDSDLKVTAKEGDVHLTGTVSSPRDRDSAAAIAWAAPGAINVINDITVV